MRKAFIVLLTMSCLIGKGYAAEDVVSLVTEAEQLFMVAQEVCAGISDEINDVRVLAGVNTGVTVAGGVAGGASVMVGLKKEDVDAEIEELEKQICASGGCDADRVQNMDDMEFLENIILPLAEIDRLMQLQEESKKLGNWRTGLLAGAAATHIASAVMSGGSSDQTELAQHIVACNNSLGQLTSVLERMKMAGVNPMEYPIRNKIMYVLDSCKRLNLEDVNKIERRENWVLGASVVGGVAAVSGVATSAAANSDKLTDDDKEKKLNTASNILGGVSTVGSATAAGFNISLLVLTNNMIKSAQQCEQEFLND